MKWRALVEEFAFTQPRDVIVRFLPHVYRAPFSPHYDEYKGHTFKVLSLRPGEHVELEGFSKGAPEVLGYVHATEITLVPQKPSIMVGETMNLSASLQRALLAHSAFHTALYTASRKRTTIKKGGK